MLLKPVAENVSKNVHQDLLRMKEIPDPPQPVWQKSKLKEIAARDGIPEEVLMERIKTGEWDGVSDLSPEVVQELQDEAPKEPSAFLGFLEGVMNGMERGLHGVAENIEQVVAPSR